MVQLSVKGLNGSWRRKRAKKAVKSAKAPLFRYHALRGMDNVRGGPRFNLRNRSKTRFMLKSARRKNKKPNPLW